VVERVVVCGGHEVVPEPQGSGQDCQAGNEVVWLSCPEGWNEHQASERLHEVSQVSESLGVGVLKRSGDTPETVA